MMLVHCIRKQYIYVCMTCELLLGSKTVLKCLHINQKIQYKDFLIRVYIPIFLVARDSPVSWFVILINYIFKTNNRARSISRHVRVFKSSRDGCPGSCMKSNFTGILVTICRYYLIGSILSSVRHVAVQRLNCATSSTVLCCQVYFQAIVV